MTSSVIADIREHLGLMLCHSVLEQRWSIHRFAARAGIPRSALYALCATNRMPSWQRLHEVATVCDHHAHLCFSAIGTPSPPTTLAPITAADVRQLRPTSYGMAWLRLFAGLMPAQASVILQMPTASEVLAAWAAARHRRHTAARALAVTPQWFLAQLRRCRVRLPPRRAPIQRTAAELRRRNRDILRQARRLTPFRVMAAAHGITVERVRQVLLSCGWTGARLRAAALTRAVALFARAKPGRRTLPEILSAITARTGVQPRAIATIVRRREPALWNAHAQTPTPA